MKSRTLPHPLHLSAIASAGLALSLAGVHAQVVIEGGPGVIQLSGQDGKTKPAATDGTAASAPAPFDQRPPGPTTIEFRAPNAVEIQPDPQSPVTVRVPVEPAPRPNPDEVSVSPAAPPSTVADAKRKAELVRELGIADSARGAKLTFSTENLYEKDSAQIDSIATGKLELLAEFMSLSALKSIAVTYHFAPSLHSDTIAWQRSVTLVQWLKVRGKVSGAPFAVNEPVPKIDQPGTQVAANSNAIPLLEKVEILIEYR